MINKIKSVFISFLCMFMIFGMFAPNEALASNKAPTTESSTNSFDIPEVDLTDDGKLDLGSVGLADGEKKGAVFSRILTEYRGIVTFISAIALISMILFFIINLIALGNSKGNPQDRQKAITGLVVSGIATAGLGSVVTITQLFFHMVK